MAEILIEVCPTCEAPLSLCGCEELARAEEDCLEASVKVRDCAKAGCESCRILLQHSAPSKEEPHGPMPAAFPEFCRVLGCKTLKDEDAQEIWNAPDRDLREVIAWDLATKTA